MKYKTLLKRGYLRSQARRLASPKKPTPEKTEPCRKTEDIKSQEDQNPMNDFKARKILRELGLTKEKIQEALKMKIRERVKRRGVISPVKTPCKCGGMGMLQEWIESDFRGYSKRYAMVFCQECNERTNVYSERTQRESRQEALNEWKLRNRK